MNPTIHKYASIHLFRTLQEIKRAADKDETFLAVDITREQRTTVYNTISGLRAAGYMITLDEEWDSIGIYW